jgi:hypothetical protein
MSIRDRKRPGVRGNGMCTGGQGHTQYAPLPARRYSYTLHILQGRPESPSYIEDSVSRNA